MYPYPHKAELGGEKRHAGITVIYDSSHIKGTEVQKSRGYRSLG